jgi:hypothetical protein
MEDGEKTKLDSHSNALDDGESLVEGHMRLIMNWVAIVAALTCIILCMPLFGLIDLYRWFKFRVFRKRD